MEARLVPINAVVALLTGTGGWPALLGDQGLNFAWLEVPVKTTKSLVVIDAVALDERDGKALVTEAKSGGSIDPAQAQKYAALTLQELRRVVTFQADPATGTIEVLYACLAEHEKAIGHGLSEIQVDVSLLVVDRPASRVRLVPSPASRLTGFDEPVPAGLPPRLVRLDADSPDEAYEAMLLAQVMAAMSRDERTIPVSTLLERVPYLANYSTQARNDLARRATQVLREIQRRFPGDFEVRPAAGNVHAAAGGTVIISRSPRDSDPRGETQGWQRLKRRAGGAGRSRRPTARDPNQLSLDDLAEQAEMGDN